MPACWRLLVLVVVLGITAVGCSDAAPPATSLAPANGDVVFGEGELPATFPENFPLPAGSVVGSTMVVARSGLTEVLVRADMEPGAVASFFDESLGGAGLTIGSSAADGDGWRIEFSDGSAKGTIEISVVAPAISEMVIRYNVS